jgi:hypothetical protein
MKMCIKWVWQAVVLCSVRLTLHFPRCRVEVAARSLQVVVVAGAEGRDSDSCSRAGAVSDH